MEKPVIVALDVDNDQQLDRILSQLGEPEETTIKIGMELFYHSGAQLVKKLADQGYDIFLDLKMHDIPNTVYNGAKQVARLGIKYTTVHALGGSEMIHVAKQGLIAGTPNDKSIPMAEQVISLAKTAKNSGADGVICSPLEVQNLRKEIGDDFLYVTPGIRPKENSNNDQKRTATPQMAKEFGSSAIVVGRPITLASNPQQAYQAIKKEFN